MDASSRESHKQWTRLLALTAAHFVIDSFPGLMHTILPAIQKSFQFSMAAGGILLTVFLVAANGIQVLIGHMRAEQERPFFLYAGMLLACCIALFAFIPATGNALLWLSFIALVCGAGVGITHPECLKAVHGLDRISSAVSSAVFMCGGVAGFAFGGWTSTWLYQRIGMLALVPFCVLSMIMFIIMLLLRIQLAVEKNEFDLQGQQVKQQTISFWMIMAIATLAACSSQTLVWIVPQRIQELEANLIIGGLGVSVFSISGGIGGILMARHASGNRELKLITRMLKWGIPFIIAYLILLQHLWAVLFLFIGSFFCFGSYPLMVSAARNTKGPNLGQRMGLIVGGIWLTACILPMLLGPIANQFGTVPILFCVPVGFILSLTLILWQKKAQSHRAEDCLNP